MRPRPDPSAGSPRASSPRARALALALALAAPSPALADTLHVDFPVDLSITAGAGAGALVLHELQADLLPAQCRWCTPGRFDAWVRGQLVWSDRASARTTSDVLGVVVPAGALVALAAPSLAQGAGRRAAEDALLVVQAYTVTVLGTEVAKVSAARLRPEAYYGTGPTGTLDSRVSFWSGHTSSTFAAATAAGTVALYRGYAAWPWIMGLGLAGAATTGYLRIAADAHWFSDVRAGAAFGMAVGVLVPILHRTRDSPVTLLPSPGGAAILVRWR